MSYNTNYYLFHLQVDRASIEEYSDDKNKPPNVELVIVAQRKSENHGDLNVNVTLMGTIPSPSIAIYQAYEPHKTKQPEPQKQLPTKQRSNGQSSTEFQPASDDG